MTLHEAYEKARTIGKDVSITASIQVGCQSDPLEFYSIRIDELHVVCCKSYEDAFAAIHKLDPDKAKAEKIANLKAELEKLES